MMVIYDDYDGTLLMMYDGDDQFKYIYEMRWVKPDK
jgi:hypothetical protein